MKEYLIETLEYDFDLPALLGRRAGGEKGVSISPIEKTRALVKCGEGGEERLTAALAAILLKDVMPLEMAKHIDAMPFELAEKQVLLPEAVAAALGRQKRAGLEEPLARRLRAELAARPRLNLEGYVRFRMGETARSWALLAARAADARLMRGEYAEIMGVLSEYARRQSPRVREVALVINADGSCTLSSSDSRLLERAQATGGGLMNILLDLSPESIAVYDLSLGRGAFVCDAVARVFPGRVRLFKRG